MAVPWLGTTFGSVVACLAPEVTTGKVFTCCSIIFKPLASLTVEFVIRKYFIV